MYEVGVCQRKDCCCCWNEVVVVGWVCSQSHYWGHKVWTLVSLQSTSLTFPIGYYRGSRHSQKLLCCFKYFIIEHILLSRRSAIQTSHLVALIVSPIPSSLISRKEIGKFLSCGSGTGGRGSESVNAPEKRRQFMSKRSSGMTKRNGDAPISTKVEQSAHTQSSSSFFGRKLLGECV